MKDDVELDPDQKGHSHIKQSFHSTIFSSLKSCFLKQSNQSSGCSELGQTFFCRPSQNHSSVLDVNVELMFHSHHSGWKEVIEKAPIVRTSKGSYHWTTENGESKWLLTKSVIRFYMELEFSYFEQWTVVGSFDSVFRF